jgi:hypothetical protein
MGTLRRFEKRLEKMFEGPFAKVFKGGVHPLEIARRLVREVDDGRVLGVNETLAPNYYQVFLGQEDYDKVSGFLDTLSSEMEAMVITHANQEGYQLLTRPRVVFIVDGELREGEFYVQASLEEPAVAPAPTRLPAGAPRQAQGKRQVGELAIVEGEGAGFSYVLEAEKTRVGRSEENDLVLEDPRVSRFHAEIDRVPEGYIIRDLGSTNGTSVGGRRGQERLLEVGDALVIGGTEMRFSLVESPLES